MRIQTKLGLGTGFLFCVILLFGVLSLISMYQLKKDSAQILSNNYETLVLCNAMHDALDKLDNDPAYIKIFEQNLHRQESNITEQGEKEATAKLRKNFALISAGYRGDSVKVLVRDALHDINMLNQSAILRKSEVANNTAGNASTWLMIIFTVLILVSFTMAVNFPTIISGPIVSLNDGINAMVNKDYRKRIHLKQKDEFGELANAFNTMAEKLDEYENSSLAKLTFEKSRIDTIINQMNDGIIGLDEQQRILFVNEAAQKLLGLQQQQISGKHSSDIAVYNDLMRTLMQDRQQDRELRIFIDGRESYFQVNFLNVKNSGQSIGDVIILRNITPFHELDEAKTNFIATISHQLKSPVIAIRKNIKTVGDAATSESTRKQLIEQIGEDADRLVEIIGGSLV